MVARGYQRGRFVVDIVGLMHAGWMTHDELMSLVRNRERVSVNSVWVRLRRLEADGHIERRGSRGSYEWRRVVRSPA